MKLFEPIEFKNLKLRNKIVMAPMCMYSAKDGHPNEFHKTHYETRAIGGVGLVIMEMTHVTNNGGITKNDLGIYDDSHIDSFKTIVDCVHAAGAKIGIQIGDAGRKATDNHPPISSTNKAHSDKYEAPHELTTEEAYEVIEAYKKAARRAILAGFDTIEIHGAHGYLIQQFSSPKTNNRDDEFGADLSLFGKKIIRAMKSEMPEGMPLLMRISASEFSEGGYDLNHGVWLAKEFKSAGVDIFHVSSGGDGRPTKERMPVVAPKYMVPFAKRIREEVRAPVIAVGILDNLNDAEKTLESADMVALGRALLKNPYWVLENDQSQKFVPKQYERGFYNRPL